MTRISYVAIILPLLVLYYASQASAQRFAPGYCPTVAAHENFDKTRFFGNWIEVEKTPSIFDLMMRCLVVDYSDDQDNTVNVVVRGVSLAGLPLTVNGDGLLQDVHRAGFYSIRYGFGVPFQGTLTTILDTDYDDYAVVYSCTNSLLSGVFHSEYIWVLSRSGKISNPTRQNIYEKLDKLAINRSGLTMSDRSTCPTNSSNVARESDKDLAAQTTSLGSASGAAAGSGAVSGAAAASSGMPSGSASPDAMSNSGAGASSSPVASLEKASAEPTQKSVVVPLLYDPPSPASSSSVGSSMKPKVAMAPVENKIQPLPISSSVSQPKQQQPVAGSKPVVSQSAPAMPSQGNGSQAQVSPSGQQQQASPGAAISKPSGQQQAQQLQPQQQQGLMAKLQQKP